ncbi:uncharacterized protein LOC108225580 [Daucus carota subsp. sativus]|uniref:uncharacterized protein LOC108225580 n=1 Tax=Daucus carota subsp. sativus TaxID=79200 RepID=UPI0007EF212D|nr:PREDICTED: uncharacterized protein LOC108225580 [Daucus carota subsp. sativus]
MVPRIKSTIIVFLVLFINLSPGTAESFNNGARSTCSLHEDGTIRVNSRRLLSHDVLDYDDAGANTKHIDPRAKRGSGGKNG